MSDQDSPDWNYYLSRDGQGHYFLDGYKRGRIVPSDDRWLLQHHSGAVFASLSSSSLPWGRSVWELSDFYRSSCATAAVTAELALSVCRLTQFSCDSGHCIGAVER